MGKSFSPSSDLLHIRKPWQNVAASCQSVARRGTTGLAILKVLVLVDESGNPVTWATPQVAKIEPRRLDAEQIKGMSREELITIVMSTLTDM